MPPRSISKRQMQYILANTTAQITNGLRSRVSYNNSWSKTGRAPAGADRIRSDRHQLLEDLRRSPTGRCRATSIGWRRRPCSSAFAAATTTATARHQRHQRAALHLQQHEYRSRGRPGRHAARLRDSRAFRRPRSTERSATSRRARTSRPTARSTPRAPASTRSSSACKLTRWATTSWPARCAIA